MSSASEIKILSKSQLLCAANPFVPVPNSERSSKASIIRYLLQQKNAEMENAIMKAAVLKREHNKAKQQTLIQIRNQKRNFERNKRWEEERRQSPTLEGDHVRVEHYLDLPMSEERHKCYRNFYNTTSSEALRMSICAVCSRENLDKVRNIKRIPFDDIPNLSRLTPKMPHPAQQLTKGLLLEVSGIEIENGKQIVQICQECHNELQKPKDLPPKLSLANGLWIGEQPNQLKDLKFIERLLISLVYPRVFVFKLHPKINGSMEEESLQRGMRGTVSSYELDTEGVAAMIHLW